MPGSNFDAYLSSSNDKFVNTTYTSDKANIYNIKSERTDELLPSRFELHQNYPNPFNSSTVIKYDLKNDVQVVIKVYDILGREVKTLVNEFQEAGFKSIDWDGTNNNGQFVASGLYLYKIIAGNFKEIKKLIIIK